MSENKPIEIICPACGKDTLLRRTPRYEGFRRVGEDLACSACGHSFPNEAEAPFKTTQQSALSRQRRDLFDQSELNNRPRIFKRDEAARLCRHCAHYVVNPFVQRCALRHKEVEATDSCAHFAPQTKSKTDKAEKQPPLRLARDG